MHVDKSTNTYYYTEHSSTFFESLFTNKDLQNIKLFNDELNSWSYAVLINGRIETDSNKIDFTKYRTIPIKYIEKYKVGVCWDFVNYQHFWFKMNNYSDESYLCIIQRSANPNDIITHTFSIVNIGNNKYWFESSWSKHQGLHKVKSYEDVIRVLLKEYYRGYPYDVYLYNPDGLDKKLTGREFFVRATKNLIYTSK